jgi:hypothetical protein
MSLSSTSDAILLEADEPEGISWGAIIAGAVAAFGLTIVLTALGAGLGLSALSPWSQRGVSATTFAVSGAIWLIITQWLASAMGGYLAGRLRVRNASTLPDDSYFRDTAHGLLSWAVATLIVVILLGSSIGSLISGGASTLSTVAGGAASGAGQAASSLPTTYYVDSLFRPGQNAATPGANPSASDADGSFASMKAEATQIMTTDLATGTWSAPDKMQLAHLIAVHTGMSDTDAQHRVDDIITEVNSAKTKLQQAADSARKAGLTFALMTALSLAIGAFISSAAGALGGHLRDEA